MYKHIIKRVKKELKNYKATHSDTNTFLNVLNSGIWIDIEKLKGLFVDVLDQVLDKAVKEIEGRRLGRRRGRKN